MESGNIIFSEGTIECAFCGKTVPDARYCMNCGNTLLLRKAPPKFLTKLERDIIKILVNRKTPIQVKQIFNKIDLVSKEVIRVYISQLTKRGLIAHPKRGHYEITDLGKERYNS